MEWMEVILSSLELMKHTDNHKFDYLISRLSTTIRQTRTIYFWCDGFFCPRKSLGNDFSPEKNAGMREFWLLFVFDSSSLLEVGDIWKKAFWGFDNWLFRDLVYGWKCAKRGGEKLMPAFQNEDRWYGTIRWCLMKENSCLLWLQENVLSYNSNKILERQKHLLKHKIAWNLRKKASSSCAIIFT